MGVWGAQGYLGAPLRGCLQSPAGKLALEQYANTIT